MKDVFGWRNDPTAGRFGITPRQRLSSAHLLTGLVVCLSVPGCTSDQSRVHEAADSQRDYGRDDIAQLLDDGDVSREDFHSSFQQMRRCYEGHGYLVDEPQVSPADGLTLLYEISGPGMVDSVSKADAVPEAVTECGEPHSRLAAVYTSTNQPVMDEAVRDEALKCIGSRGGTVNEDAVSFEDMVGEPDSDGGAQRRLAAQCVSESVYALHPEIRSVPLGY